ncbi:MAG TPA: hypothetical protein VMH20_16385 [Verrucomicrobiae bacterium]|nr:hypothetical protein [Verrucomicrobiae bacterium]
MKVREAKDFLVVEIKEQAAIEGQPLSELEIRMLYFSERNNSEKAEELAKEFDESYDMQSYEQKISSLMKHAHARLKQGDAPALGTWDEAIRRLRKGDHYILVMWDGGVPVSLHLFVAGVLILAVAIWMGITHLLTHFAPPNPRVVLEVFVAFIVLLILFQRQLGASLAWLLGRTVLRFIDRESDERD